MEVARSEDCPNNVFEGISSQETTLNGRWNRRLVLRKGESEYYNPMQTEIKELTKNIHVAATQFGMY